MANQEYEEDIEKVIAIIKGDEDATEEQSGASRRTTRNH